MKAKEMISLNSGRAEFSADMGLEERLEKLTSAEMQTVKGRCTLMDSSSSSETTPCLVANCKTNELVCIECPDCGWNCVTDINSCLWDDVVCTFECWEYDSCPQMMCPLHT